MHDILRDFVISGMQQCGCLRGITFIEDGYIHIASSYSFNKSIIKADFQ